MSEIATQHEEAVLQPLTGELIPVGDIPRLADALQQIRDYRGRLQEAADAVAAALIAESIRQGTRTLNISSHVKIEVSPDTEIDWDLDELEKLRDAGLPVDRYDALVTATVSYKVDGRVARQLEGANEEYKAIIDRARRRVPKRQYVSLKDV